MAKSSVSRDYAAVTPYLRIKGAAEAIAFYVKAFGAKERYRLPMGDRLGHAEIDIGGSVIMLSDEFPDHGAIGPATLKGTTVVLNLNVANADATFKKAVAVIGAYPTLSALLAAYGECEGALEKRALLERLPLSSGRNLGPKASTAIAKAFLQ